MCSELFPLAAFFRLPCSSGIKVLLISGLLTRGSFRLGYLPFCDGISNKIAVAISVPLSLKAPLDYDNFIEQ